MPDTFNMNDPFALTHKYQGKPKSTKKDSKSLIPSFSLTGGFSANLNDRTSSNQFNKEGYGTGFTPKSVSWDIVKPNKVTGPGSEGLQLSSGYINKDTLKKGTHTILGISKQVDQFGNVIRGKNYANPDFYAYEASQDKLKENERIMDNWYDATGGTAGQQKQNKVGTNKPKPKEPVSQERKDAMSKNVAANNEIRRQSRRLDFISNMGRNPTVAEANKIQEELGRGKVGYQKVYRGYSKVRFDMQFDKDPSAIIDDYQKKQYVNEWAQKIDPESAKLDPNRTVSVVDKKSGYTATRYWTHNNRKRAVGTYYVNTSTYKDVLVSEHSSKGDKMDMVFKKVQDVSKKKKDRYETYFRPVDDSVIDGKLDSLRASKKAGASYVKMNSFDFYRGGGVNGPYAKKIQAINMQSDISHAKSMKELKSLELEKEYGQYTYYALTEQTFGDYETNKQDMTEETNRRRFNQEVVIDELNLKDRKSIKDVDRSKHLLETLEGSLDELDVKKEVLQKDIDKHDWQKQISQETFGTDEIQGNSHILDVQNNTGQELRGGAYYSQDAGKLIRQTKEYEKEMLIASEGLGKKIKDNIITQDQELPNYYVETEQKEYDVANKDYLEKSLELTKEERKLLEKQRRAQGMSGGQKATQYKVSSSRGRPTLKQKSQQSSQYNNKRTRGGRNTFGGLVV